MATYGEGEPADNAVTLTQNVFESDFEFSNGAHRLEGLKYVMFGLGNKTYEHYNAIARKMDTALTEMGAVRIGERGEGDDDRSMEEDYLEWKDGMWEAFAQEPKPLTETLPLMRHESHDVYSGPLRFPRRARQGSRCSTSFL